MTAVKPSTSVFTNHTSHSGQLHSREIEKNSPSLTTTSVDMSSSPDQETRQAEARAAVVASLNSVQSSYNVDLQARSEVHGTSKSAIDLQERELQRQTRALASDSMQWEKLFNSTTKQMRDFGDVQNWAEMIERDLLVVEETLRLVEGREESGNASGTPGL